MRGARFPAFLLGLAAAILIAGCGGSDNPQVQDTSLRQLNQRGLKLSVTADNTSYIVGAPVTLSLQITNSSGVAQTVSLSTTDPLAFPPLRFVIQLGSGQVVRLASVTDTPAVTIPAGATVTYATFVWDQTNNAGQQVATGTYLTSALVGEVIADGQHIFNPFGTIFVPGPNVRIANPPAGT